MAPPGVRMPDQDLGVFYRDLNVGRSLYDEHRDLQLEDLLGRIVVAYYDETQAHRLVNGTRGDCDIAGRLMRREAGRIRLDQANEKVGNVDGSPWIRNQVQRHSLPLDALGLDFYHLSENVHKARREIYGEDDEAGNQWAGELLHKFKHQGYERRPSLLCLLSLRPIHEAGAPPRSYSGSRIRPSDSGYL